MDEEVIKITPDRERVRSILDMVGLREKRILAYKSDEFSTLLVEDYYEVIKELATAVLNLHGCKTLSHKMLFDYLGDNFKVFTLTEIEFIHELRKIRNKVAYEGFFVKPSFLKRNEAVIKSVISKLKGLLTKKLI